MALQIYTNNQSAMAQKYLEASSSSLESTVERLSSGLRINHAADDASGLTITDKFREQVVGLAKASFNAQDAISLLQTAEGGLEVVSDVLHRMRELAVQAGNGIYTSNDRAELQKEVDLLKTEIDRVAVSIEFNTKKLLDGSASGLWSSTTADIEAIVKGAPAEGNYRLTINTEPGKNAVYKTSPFMTDFYTTFDQITLPKGITNVEVDGIDSSQISWSITHNSVSYPSTKEGSTEYYQRYVYNDALYSGDYNMAPAFGFWFEEDQKGPARFEYPYYNFAGYYVGIERVTRDNNELVINGGQSPKW